MERIEASKFFTEGNGERRNNGKKLFKNRFEQDIRRHTFSQRIIDDWNSLAELTVNSESLNIFKSRLDKHWKTEWFKISTEE